jgi:DNA-binding beta-propeller fold protein YncE
MHNKRTAFLRVVTCFILLAIVFAFTVYVLPVYAVIDKLYYTTNDDWSVKRANLDGTGVETLHVSVTGTPHGIVLDTINGKVYFTDNHSSVAKIQRMNLDGTELEDVLTGVWALAIALDVSAGKIYYTTNDDWSVETLYTSATGTPHGITLDLDVGKIYFSDNHSSVAKIQRMNLDGTDLEDVVTGVWAVALISNPPVPTALRLTNFSAHNYFSTGVWIPAAVFLFGLSGVLVIIWRKSIL